MNTVYRIFFTLLSFAVPFILLMLIVFADFFINGSGAQSSTAYEAQRPWWITAYIVAGILHIALLYRILRPWQLALKLAMLFLLTVMYVYYGLEF